jgi:hypothetical protein
MPRRRLAAPALVLALAAAPALAQIPFSDALENPTTCGQYLVMDSLARIETLSTIEPGGDDLGTGDAVAAEEWAGAVATACEGHPDRALTDAARRALTAR